MVDCPTPSSEDHSKAEDYSDYLMGGGSMYIRRRRFGLFVTATLMCSSAIALSASASAQGSALTPGRALTLTSASTLGHAKAHVSSTVTLRCKTFPQYPHVSTTAKRKGVHEVVLKIQYVCFTVSYVAGRPVVTPAVMRRLVIRAALYRNHALAGQRTFDEGTTAGGTVVLAVPCSPGLWQGWTKLIGLPPSGFVQRPSHVEGWGTPVGIRRC